MNVLITIITQTVAVLPLNITWILPVCLSIPQSLESTLLFTVSVASPFLGYHVVIYTVDFRWLLTLSKVHFSLCYVSSWFITHFDLLVSDVPLCGYCHMTLGY